MTREEKQILVKDLCARLPYHVKVEANVCPRALFPMDVVMENLPKPYLRPLSSMTEEEKEQMIHLWIDADIKTHATRLIDFYNEYHLDYRGLIPIGLAIEAPEGMYDIKNKKKGGKE